MHKNPFSPSFSIRPERFYGRTKELDLFKQAIANSDSADRFLFITGTRGCGKTSLIHQYALIAKKQKWLALETTYQNALEELRKYAGINGTSSTETTLSPSLTIAGTGGSIGSVSKRNTTQPEHLASAFCKKLKKMVRNKGLLITIDEIQKMPEADMEEISHAVQAAKTQGFPVALIIAGLPLAHGKIGRYKGCTFIQRMRRYMLGMLTATETQGFLTTMLALVPEICLDEEQIEELARFSAGHPYLLQLVGNYVYEITGELKDSGQVTDKTLSAANIRDAEQRALADYQINILQNLLVGVRNGTEAYLRAMCDVSGDDSTARTSDIAEYLGKTLSECSTQRARIIDLQLAFAPEKGKLRFTLPYMPLAFENRSFREPVHDEDMLPTPKTLI